MPESLDGQSKQRDKRAEHRRSAEFSRVVQWLDSQGIKLSRGWDGDPCYAGGHRLRNLAERYAKGDRS